MSENVFIAVELDDGITGDAELAKKLEAACPVDIYAATDNGVEVVERNLDECILCRLCIDAAPAGTVRIVKLYDDGPERVLSSEGAGAP